MRNFILFVRRFFNLILFLGLEALCFVLIARTNTMQGADVLSSANAVSGYLYQRQNAVVSYFGLGTMNDSLLRENARLRQQLAVLGQETDTLRDSTAVRRFEEIHPENDSVKVVRYARYTYRMARVINNSVSERNNFITLNRGADDGIRKGMAVISGTGVVGRVVHVSAHFASAISILSDRQPVSGKLKDGLTATVKWRYGKPDYLEMEDVPQESKVYRGDSVLTTAYSFAPPDVLIGRVERIKKVRKNNSQTLILRSATNFRNLMYVYVVENALLNERHQLEDSARIDFRPKNSRP